MNAANNRYFVFFLLGPLIRPCLAFDLKKEKEKVILNRKLGKGRDAEEARISLLSSLVSVKSVFMFVSCRRFRSRESFYCMFDFP